MGLYEELEKLNKRVDDGTYRAQFEYGEDDLRKEMLGTADLLFEVADKVEEILTDLMVRKGFAAAAGMGAPQEGGGEGDGEGGES